MNNVYSDFLTIDDINVDDCRLWSIGDSCNPQTMSLQDAKSIFKEIHYDFLKILDYEDKLKQQHLQIVPSKLQSREF